MTRPPTAVSFPPGPPPAALVLLLPVCDVCGARPLNGRHAGLVDEAAALISIRTIWFVDEHPATGRALQDLALRALVHGLAFAIESGGPVLADLAATPDPARRAVIDPHGRLRCATSNGPVAGTVLQEPLAYLLAGPAWAEAVHAAETGPVRRQDGEAGAGPVPDPDLKGASRCSAAGGPSGWPA